MATLIVEVDDDKLKMVKDVLKAIGVSVNKKTAKTQKTPNEITVQAMKDARNGKVTKAESVDALFKSI
jgi:antitoxin component of RelBE/YafQ-DinJ toxin-antitoxin module